jgi:hypothetical protein
VASGRGKRRGAISRGGATWNRGMKGLHSVKLHGREATGTGPIAVDLGRWRRCVVGGRGGRARGSSCVGRSE